MAEVNAKDLTTKTAPASTDSMLLFGTTTNEGAKITVDNLANNILERIATKTFPNQVGGSSAATILAQLATLNSNTTISVTSISSDYLSTGTALYKIGRLCILPIPSPQNIPSGQYFNMDFQVPYPIQHFTFDFSVPGTLDTIRWSIFQEGAQSSNIRIYNYTDKTTGTINAGGLLVWISRS